MAGDLGENFDRNCARLIRLRKNYVGSARKEQAGDFVHGFITHRAVNKNDASIGEIFIPKIAQLARSGRIMRAIEENCGMIGDFFKASGPTYIRDALLDRPPIY